MCEMPEGFALQEWRLLQKIPVARAGREREERKLIAAAPHFSETRQSHVANVSKRV